MSDGRHPPRVQFRGISEYGAVTVALEAASISSSHTRSSWSLGKSASTFIDLLPGASTTDLISLHALEPDIPFFDIHFPKLFSKEIFIQSILPNILIFSW